MKKKRVTEASSSLSTYLLCELEIKGNKPSRVVGLSQGQRGRMGKMRAGRSPLLHLLQGISSPAPHLIWETHLVGRRKRFCNDGVAEQRTYRRPRKGGKVKNSIKERREE